MRTKFAEIFTDMLRTRGISQSQFARLYGVKQNTVNQWANGKREPTYYDLLCICTLLDIDVKDMLGYTPRIRKALLRDIIAGNEGFQKEQRDLQNRLFKEGKTDEEVVQECEALYQRQFEEYKRVFNFND